MFRTSAAPPIFFAAREPVPPCTLSDPTEERPLHLVVYVALAVMMSVVVLGASLHATTRPPATSATRAQPVP